MYLKIYLCDKIPYTLQHQLKFNIFDTSASLVSLLRENLQKNSSAISGLILIRALHSIPFSLCFSLLEEKNKNALLKRRVAESTLKNQDRKFTTLAIKYYSGTNTLNLICKGSYLSQGGKKTNSLYKLLVTLVSHILKSNMFGTQIKSHFTYPVGIM